MICPYCGSFLANGTKFCPECGKKLDAADASALNHSICPFCGEILELDSIFCENCGRPLSNQSFSAAYTPRTSAAAAPPPIPPMPESASAHPKAEPGSKQSNAIPIVIAVILGVVLLSFVIVQYGDSIMTLLKPEQGMPQDFDIEPPTIVTADSGPDTAPPQTNESPSDPAQEPEPSPHYDPQDYETFEPATLADFNWVTYDIAHGILPTGMDRLESFAEIEGGWKLYIIDEPSGENSTTMERLCRCTFAEDEQGRGMRITWDYVHNNATDEGFEDHSPDSFYYGSWEDGVFDGLGTGGVTITDFWNANGHEYAVGRISWPDGIHAVMYLARP